MPRASTAPALGPAVDLPPSSGVSTGKASSKEVPVCRNKDPVGHALGTQLGLGSCSAPETAASEIRVLRTQMRTVLPQRKEAVGEEATGCSQCRRPWGQPGLRGEVHACSQATLPLLFPELDFTAGWAHPLHTHQHTCAHTKTYTPHVHTGTHTLTLTDAHRPPCRRMHTHMNTPP